jgi:hypothetical protein
MKQLGDILGEYGLLEVRASWVNQRKGRLLNVIDNNVFMFLWSIGWMILLAVQAITVYGHWSTYVLGAIFTISTYVGHDHLKKTVKRLRAQWLKSFAVTNKDTYDLIVKKYRKEVLNYLVGIK